MYIPCNSDQQQIDVYILKIVRKVPWAVWMLFSTPNFLFFTSPEAPWLVILQSAAFNGDDAIPDVCYQDQKFARTPRRKTICLHVPI